MGKGGSLHRVLLFITIFLVGFVTSGISQRLGYQLYTVEEGLVQSEVTAIFQDKKGFLWIGTKSGISRFDGHAFQTIRDSSGIADSWVFSIFQPNDSVIVIQTRKGFVRYFYGQLKDRVSSTEFFTHVSCLWAQEGAAQIMVNEDQSVRLYRFCGDSLVGLDSSFLDKLEGYLPPSGTRAFAFSTRDSLLYFRGIKGQLHGLTTRGEVITLPISSFYKFIVGADGFIYILTPDHQLSNYLSRDFLQSWNGYVSKLSERVKLYQLARISTRLIHDFGLRSEIQTSSIYVENADSVYFSIPDEPCIGLITREGDISAKLDFAAFNCLYFDRENNLWAGSPLGLVRLFPLCFTHYTDKDGLYPNLQCILQDKEGAMIAGGYERGLQKLVAGNFSPIQDPEAIHWEMDWQVSPGSGRDSDGILHICINPYGHFLWDGQRLTHPAWLPLNAALSFYEDVGRKIDYYGTNRGLLKHDRETLDYTIEAVSPGNKINETVSMILDRQRRLWLGGFQGLSIMDQDSIIVFPNDQHNYSWGANALAKDHRQTIWIGNTDGLWQYDNKRFSKVVNPWFNDLVVSLTIVGRSWLFIGGVHGIGFLDLEAFYSRDTVVIRYFNTGNGFSGKECQQNAVCVDEAKTVWVATTNSLQRIDPSGFPRVFAGPITYVTVISTLDDGMSSNPLVSTALRNGEINLKHDQNNLRFDYTAIWFRGPGFVRFRYRLTGQDAGWAHAVAERFVTYTNLSPGRYEFQVIACHEDGLWTEEPASVTVIIHPAFWQTWWFLLICCILGVIIVSGSTWLVFHSVRQRKQRELVHKQTVAELQFKTFRNQLAPHFIFNALNAIGSTIYRNELKQSYDLLHKFSQLIRSTLVHAENTSRTIAEEIEFVQYYMEIEKIRFDGRIDYRLHVSEGVKHEQQVPRMIIQTFVENSVKHGLMHKDDEGLIEVTVDHSTTHMIIIVEDNGIGRDAAAKFRGDSTGKGMEIIREFIRLFNSFNVEKITVEIKDLFDSSGDPSGTRVTIHLPMNFSYTFDNDKAKNENGSRG